MAKSGEYPNVPMEDSVGGDCMDHRAPIRNLSTVKERMDSVHRFLWESINSNTILADDQIEAVSSEISAAIHQIIVNGAALLSSFQHPAAAAAPILRHRLGNPKPSGEDLNDCEIVELDAVELLAEHAHFCEICGKGFKRDANLRMHMRAHGDQYKTAEALSKPSRNVSLGSHGKTRFSCPFEGCNRNRRHDRFKPLKSAICVRNHFKRSHCPKLYSCHRCRSKSFSVLADLKSHLKRCGESAAAAASWLCSCGTSFSRKDKLFGHVATFEGHMPATVDAAEDKSEAEKGDEEMSGGVAKMEGGIVSDCRGDGLFDGLLVDGFDSIENYSLQDILGSSSSGKDGIL